MCVSYVGTLCASKFGLGWVHDVFIVACYMFMHFYAYVPFFSFFLILLLIRTFLLLSLSLSVLFWIVYAWHLSTNPLRPRTLFVLEHLLLLILLLFTFDSVIRRLIRTSQRTSPDVAFIRNARLFFLTSSILIYPLSFTVGVGNPFVISWSAVPPWSYRSFIPIYTNLIILYFAFSLLFKEYVL